MVSVWARIARAGAAKAPVDECFNGVGKPLTYPDADGTCATGIPKVNESYVWGLTKAGPTLWFGTASNVLCGVLFGYLPAWRAAHLDPIKALRHE